MAAQACRRIDRWRQQGFNLCLANQAGWLVSAISLSLSLVSLAPGRVGRHFCVRARQLKEARNVSLVARSPGSQWQPKAERAIAVASDSEIETAARLQRRRQRLPQIGRDGSVRLPASLAALSQFAVCSCQLPVGNFGRQLARALPREQHAQLAPALFSSNLYSPLFPLSSNSSLSAALALLFDLPFLPHFASSSSSVALARPTRPRRLQALQVRPNARARSRCT